MKRFFISHQCYTQNRIFICVNVSKHFCCWFRYRCLFCFFLFLLSILVLFVVFEDASLAREKYWSAIDFTKLISNVLKQWSWILVMNKIIEKFIEKYFWFSVWILSYRIVKIDSKTLKIYSQSREPNIFLFAYVTSFTLQYIICVIRYKFKELFDLQYCRPLVDSIPSRH